MRSPEGKGTPANVVRAVAMAADDVHTPDEGSHTSVLASTCPHEVWTKLDGQPVSAHPPTTITRPSGRRHAASPQCDVVIVPVVDQSGSTRIGVASPSRSMSRIILR